MNFTEVLPLLLAGASAAARDLDCTNQRIYLVKGSIAKDPAAIISAGDVASEETSNIPLRFFEAGDIGTITRLPRFDARDTLEHTVTGWTPTAADLLADDWFVLNEHDYPI